MTTIDPMNFADIKSASLPRRNFVIYLLPRGLMYVAGCISIVTNSSFHFDLGPAGLLLWPLFLWPVVHLFI